MTYHLFKIHDDFDRIKDLHHRFTKEELELEEWKEEYYRPPLVKKADLKEEVEDGEEKERLFREGILYQVMHPEAKMQDIKSHLLTNKDEIIEKYSKLPSSQIFA